jgi:hypothetical protein
MDFRTITFPEIGDITPQGRDWSVSLKPIVVVQSPPIVIASDVSGDSCTLDIDVNESKDMGKKFNDWLTSLVSHIQSIVNSKTHEKFGIDTILDVKFRIVDKLTCYFVTGEEIEVILDFRGVTLKQCDNRFVGRTRFRIMACRNTGNGIPQKLFI